jgi:hypothetical protein
VTLDVWADCELTNLIDGELKAGSVQEDGKLFLPAHGIALLAPAGER